MWFGHEMMAIIWQSEFLAHPEIWFAGNHSIPEPSGRSCFIRRVLAVRLALKAKKKLKNLIRSDQVPFKVTKQEIAAPK
jgi:hypothetical protein